MTSVILYPPPVSKTYSKRKRQPTMFLMNNHPSNKNKRVAFKLPRNIEVGRHHDKSISIMTSEVNTNQNSDNNKNNGCSYMKCLIENLKLENCAIKNCFNKLHHICHKHIDNVLYDGDFESKFGLIFCCSEYIVERMKHLSPLWSKFI